MTPDKRIEIPFLNTAKTICIFLVVLAHLPIPSDLCSFISVFRMPLFFLVSGYLVSFKKYTFKQFFIRKFKTLMIPYFFFAIVSFLFWYLVGRRYGDDALNPGDVKKFFLGIFYAAPLKEYLGFNLPIWFLPSLFCSELIFFFCRKWMNNREYLLVTGLFLMGILFRNFVSFRLPWGLDVSFFVLVFMYAGFLVKKYRVGELFFMKTGFSKRILLSLFFLLLTILIGYTNDMDSRISVRSLHFNNYLLFIAGGLSGSCFILFLSSCIKSAKLWHFYGRNTIVILGFHVICFSLIKGFQVFILQIPVDIIYGSVVYNLLYVICAFGMLAPVIYLINIYMPFLLGREKAIL